MTLAGASCWGLSGSMAQYLFTAEHMESRWLVPVRMSAAGVILLAYCFVHYGRRQTLLPFGGWKRAGTMLFYAIAGIAACQYLYFTTIQLSNAAIGTILQNLAPVLVLLYVCVRNNRLPGASEIFSILLALFGVFLLTTHGDIRSLTVPEAAIVTGLLSAIAVMIYNVVSPSLTKESPVLIIQGWAFLIGGILFSVLFRVWNSGCVLTPGGFIGIVFVVAVGCIAAYPLYIAGVAIIGPQKAVLYSFAEAVTAAIVSALFLQTRYTVCDLGGFICIFFMLWIITV